MAQVAEESPDVILSQTSVYALKAVMHLADSNETGPVRVDDIAQALDVPRNYLSKILHVLARAGLLHSTRGPKGGFRLATRPSELCLADVIRHFDEITEHSGCLLGRDECSAENPCAAHARWADVSAAVQGFLATTTIEDLSSHSPRLDVLPVRSDGSA